MFDVPFMSIYLHYIDNHLLTFLYLHPLHLQLTKHRYAILLPHLISLQSIDLLLWIY
jgi:hypothetical protein